MESGLYDVSGYDALQLRVRGDGRRFIANLSAPSMGRKDDIWQSFVFTRGGPEWEDITVRISRFLALFFSHYFCSFSSFTTSVFLSGKTCFFIIPSNSCRFQSFS